MVGTPQEASEYPGDRRRLVPFPLVQLNDAACTCATVSSRERVSALDSTERLGRGPGEVGMWWLGGSPASKNGQNRYISQ